MISALNFKPFNKGSLRGFFDLRYHGLTIKGCRLMAGKGGLWVALPQKEINKDGERKWVDQLYLTPPEMDHVRRLVIADLESQGHLDHAPKEPAAKRPPYRPPEKEDLSEYYTQGTEDNIPF